MATINFKKQMFIVLGMLLVGSIFLNVLASALTTSAQAPPTTPLRVIRTYDNEELGLSSPGGLAYSAESSAFYVLEADRLTQPLSAETDVVKIAPYAERQGAVRLASALQDPVNVVFDNYYNRLLILKADIGVLLEVREGNGGALNPGSLVRHNVRQLNIQDPQGLTIDPANGRLYILDAAGARILEVVPDGDGRFTNPTITTINLQITGLVNPRGIAFNPTTGSLFTLNPSEQKLYELTTTGQLIATREVDGIILNARQSMVFAPTSDVTDDSANLSLYIINADDQNSPSLNDTAPAETLASPSEGNRAGGTIYETSLLAPMDPVPGIPIDPVTLVKLTHTSLYSPPSPDPAGIAYISTSNTLLISDSEVNEMPQYFTGSNLFETSLSGNLIRTLTTINFSDEPTGVAHNPANNFLYFSDDTGNRGVYELNPGPDGLYNTSDDVITFYNLGSSSDPEGVTYGQGRLYVSDGDNAEIYIINLGANGVLDPSDSMTQFDVDVMGIRDPEGVEYDPDNGHLYILSSRDELIAETTTDGTLIRYLDISSLNSIKAAGLAYAPASTNPAARHLYIVDRAIDNGPDPDENDGVLYEVSFPHIGPIEPTLTPTNTATNTPGPSPTPTLVPVCATYNSTNTPINLPVGTTSISSAISVSGVSGEIRDVNVSVDMPHTWVGDLIFTVSSPGGSNVTIMDRPGVPASTYGCSGDNILATFDDAAALPVENQCASTTPTINGTFSPNNPLSAFNSQVANGTWTLQVQDAYPSEDGGLLNSWSVEICTDGSAPTATNTPVPPTATNTPTNTPVPPTATSTPTGTLISPTATSTPTNTPLPPTATSTPTATPDEAGDTFTFTAVADAAVVSNRGNVNFGSSTTLAADGQPTINSYLRFDVQNLTGNLSSATLRLWANSTNSTGIEAAGVANNSWGETTITYNNAPPAGAVLGSSGAIASGSWVEVDVTSFVTANGLVSFMISTTDNGRINFDSREAVNAPQLVIITSGGPSPTATNTATPGPSPTPTNTATPTTTPDPGTGQDYKIYLSMVTSGVIGGITYSNEDVLVYDPATDTWDMYFHGSNVGITLNNLNAFYRMPDGSLLLSFTRTQNFGSLSNVTNADIVRFIPTSLGSTTAGTFEMFLDGSDVGLQASGENIDAIGFTPDGRLLISTVGTYNANGITGGGNNLLVLNDAVFGDNTSGTWALYFNGADVGLTESTENINSVSVAANGDIYLTTSGEFTVPGASGTSADIFVCAPGSLGSNTSCTFSLYWSGSGNGLGNQAIDGLFVED